MPIYRPWEAFVHLQVFGGASHCGYKGRLGTRTVFRVPVVLKQSEAYPEKDDFSGRQRWVISKGSGDW